MTRDRRWGTALVVAAALALIIVSRTSGRGATGEPVAVPWSTPPTIGECLLTHDTDVRGGGPTAVPCDQLHTVEVLQSWRKGRQPDQHDDLCAAPVTVSTVSAPTDWTAPDPLVVRRYLSGGEPLGWAACVLGPITGGPMMQALPFTGSLRESSAGQETATIPVCFRDAEQQVACAEPHFAQRLGEFRSSDLTARPRTDCADLARELVGVNAFGTSDALVTRVSGSDTGGWTGASAKGFESVLWCDVAPADPGRSLVGSVIGLGDQPIPYG